MLLESRFPKETFRKRFVPAFVAFAFALGAAGFGFAEPPEVTPLPTNEKAPEKPDPKKLVEKNEPKAVPEKGKKQERMKVEMMELQKEIDEAVKKGDVQEVQRLMKKMMRADFDLRFTAPLFEIHPEPRMPKEAVVDYLTGTIPTRFGLSVSPVDSVVADQLDLPSGKGLTVTRVEHGSAAQKSGVLKHDILISFAGNEVTSDVEKFRKLVESIEPGTEFEVVVKRKGKEETLKGCKIPALKPENATFKEGQFALGSSNGKVSINIKGSMKDGKKEVEMIVITKDGKTETYKSLEEVPEEQREAVKKLIQ